MKALYNTMQENKIYTVEDVKLEVKDVFTLYLSCEGLRPVYTPGQFITIFFPETGHLEGKSYSISSAPHEKYIAITVKGVGEFSNKLISKKNGDKITASLPYGYFYSESETSTAVIVTGGIGVAPFRSMIVNMLHTTSNRKIILFYSSKNRDSIIFKQEFDCLREKYADTFFVTYHVTQEDAEDCIFGRIQAQEVVTKNEDNTEFFICGSIAFVRDYWKSLTLLGVAEECIYTEAFF